nr:uncharacterized protein LOC128694608 [Cherax quadricarinatus]
MPYPGSCIQESIRLPPDIFPSPLTQGQPQLHVFMPYPGSCIQEFIRLPPDIFPSPLTQGQPQLHVFMPYPGSCIQESIRSLRMSPLPHLPKVSLNNNLPQVHVSRNPSARSQMSSLTHLPKVGGAFPGSVSPGVHLCHLSGLPFPLSQGQRYSCHSQDHVSRNPSVYRRISSLPHLPKVSLNNNLPQVHVSRNPSARFGCLPLPTCLRSAVPFLDHVSRSPLVS